MVPESPCAFGCKSHPAAMTPGYSQTGPCPQHSSANQASASAHCRLPYSGLRNTYCALQFLTNIFHIAFIALRETLPAQPEEGEAEDQTCLPALAPLAGWAAAVVGIVSIGWAVLARPEYGGVAERLQYASASLTGDRHVAFRTRRLTDFG